MKCVQCHHCHCQDVRDSEDMLLLLLSHLRYVRTRCRHCCCHCYWDKGEYLSANAHLPPSTYPTNAFSSSNYVCPLSSNGHLPPLTCDINSSLNTYYPPHLPSTSTMSIQVQTLVSHLQCINLSPNTHCPPPPCLFNCKCLLQSPIYMPVSMCTHAKSTFASICTLAAMCYPPIHWFNKKTDHNWFFVSLRTKTNTILGNLTITV